MANMLLRKFSIFIGHDGNRQMSRHVQIGVTNGYRKAIRLYSYLALPRYDNEIINCLDDQANDMHLGCEKVFLKGSGKRLYISLAN